MIKFFFACFSLFYHLQFLTRLQPDPVNQTGFKMCTQLLWSDGAVAGQIRIGSAASKVDLKFDFRVYLDQIPFIGFELFHQLRCSNFLDLIFESECLRVSPGTSPQFLSSKHPPWHPGTQTVRWVEIDLGFCRCSNLSLLCDGF